MPSVRTRRPTSGNTSPPKPSKNRSHDKPEGLTILNDSTIAVVNDNDFGIASPAADGSIELTGKTTRLYIFGLPEKLGYQSPYCTFDLAQTSLSGTYSVTVINAVGCESTDAVLVSIISGTAEPQLAGRLTLFPNPTTGWAYLRVDQFEPGSYAVTVLDLLGRAVARESLEIGAAEGTFPVDLNRLPSGAYLLRLSNAKGALTRRLVVE